MRRHALSDEQWERIADMMPRNDGPGRPWSDHRLIIDGTLCIHATGVPRRDLPERFGPWKTVYERFRLWVREGFWDQILDRLQARRHADGEIDWELFFIDGSVVRAHKASAGAAGKRAAGPTGRPCVGPVKRGLRDETACGV